VLIAEQHQILNEEQSRERNEKNTLFITTRRAEAVEGEKIKFKISTRNRSASCLEGARPPP
jgi:hypothetical protein